jgi:hypothetical protein
MMSPKTCLSTMERSHCDAIRTSADSTSEASLLTHPRTYPL